MSNSTFLPCKLPPCPAKSGVGGGGGGGGESPPPIPPLKFRPWRHLLVETNTTYTSTGYAVQSVTVNIEFAK